MYIRLSCPEQENSTLDNKLRGYKCSIEYIEGKKNVCADMLSCLPHPTYSFDNSGDSVPHITDRTFEVNLINNSDINPKRFAQYDHQYEDKQCNKEELDIPGFDLVMEQSKDKELVQLKDRLQSEKMSSSVASKYIILDNILYYLSKSGLDPIIRMYIPSHLKQLVIEHYHEKNGHMGIAKTYDSIKGKYYWPNVYKELYQHMNPCVICQRKNLRKVKSPLQETDAPPFPLAKFGIDISGPYPTTLSGNKYISFVDWYSGWPKAYLFQIRVQRQ